MQRVRKNWPHALGISALAALITACAATPAAGIAVAHGLAWEAGLAALTSNPAEIFGVTSRNGSIARGRPADLVLWSGDPLEVTTLAQRVFIEGQSQTMQSRQTLLRGRYLEKLKAHAAR